MTLLWLVACGPSDWEAFEDKRIEAVCARTFECHDAEDLAALGIDDEGVCRAAMHLVSQSDETCDYHPAVAGKCLRETEAQACEDFVASIEPASCGDVCETR